VSKDGRVYKAVRGVEIIMGIDELKWDFEFLEEEFYNLGFPFFCFFLWCGV